MSDDTPPPGFADDAPPGFADDEPAVVVTLPAIRILLRQTVKVIRPVPPPREEGVAK